jgi:hypothetical protein
MTSARELEGCCATTTAAAAAAPDVQALVHIRTNTACNSDITRAVGITVGVIGREQLVSQTHIDQAVLLGTQALGSQTMSLRGMSRVIRHISHIHKPQSSLPLTAPQ